MYAYAADAPTLFKDPLGEDIWVTYTNGISQSFTDVQSFASAVNVALPGTISEIDIHGHGPSDGMHNTISYYKSKDTELLLRKGDTVYLIGAKNGQIQAQGSFTDLVRIKLASESSIIFRGCHTSAAGGIAEITSKLLPKVRVFANSAYGSTFGAHRIGIDWSVNISTEFQGGAPLEGQFQGLGTMTGGYGSWGN